MDFSIFGNRISKSSGIMELMDDLGNALNGKDKKYMLGGGNPSHIEEVNKIWRKRISQIMSNENDFEKMFVNYDAPQGNISFLESLANLLNKKFNWNITAENIGISNGSQNGYFILLNIFSGLYKNNQKRKILLPIVPEYIGYSDQLVSENSFQGTIPKIVEVKDNFFKYNIDFDSLNISNDISAICVSRPTNPTGNVISDEELTILSDIATKNNIPLFIDNAYGLPFPSIIFDKATPIWNENIVYSMSLSKLGIPSVRTGIFVARKEIIKALSRANAIMNLSNSTIGQFITKPLIENGDIIRISEEIIKPYYYNKSRKTIKIIQDTFGDSIDYKIHVSQGALFLWIWFKNLPITTSELYEKLKEKNVLVVPGKYFFFGLDKKWNHSEECIRITYSQSEEDIKTAFQIIHDVIRAI
ncbi:MAG: valine--pyruvate transaminase [Clostridiales bacterium]